MFAPIARGDRYRIIGPWQRGRKSACPFSPRRGGEDEGAGERRRGFLVGQGATGVQVPAVGSFWFAVHLNWGIAGQGIGGQVASQLSFLNFWSASL